MLTVISVLRSGGDFDAGWVEKLQAGVHRNLTIPHRFVCLSDTDVPWERIPIDVDWPGWWPKILLFKPGIVIGPTVFFDLDTVITGNIDGLARIPCDFSVLRNFFQEEMIGGGMFWFRNEDCVPHQIYHKFAKMPDAYMAHHIRERVGTYVGDQGFIFDVLGADIDKIQDHFDGIRGYKYHCRKGLPEGTKIVCFAGKPRPNEVDTEWMRTHWAS